MTNDPLRIPITRSVSYAARGLPDLPFLHGPGVIKPYEITLTYRAAPDSQLGRVHAYVKGRLWADGREVFLADGYGQHYDDGLDGWPEWLAEEARLHDPDAASVPCVPVTQPADADRRDLITEVIREFPFDDFGLDDVSYLLEGEPDTQEWVPKLADAVLAVLPDPVVAPLSQAERDMLRYALDLAQEQLYSRGDEFGEDDQPALDSLRRLAGGEQQPDEPEPDDPRKTVRNHVLALHQIGEQLAGIESWFWEHLAYVRATAVAHAAVPAAVEEQPESETPEPAPPAEYRHTCHDQTSAPGRDYDCQWCSTLPDSLPSVQQPEIVHGCPPDGSGLTPCCGRTPFELPRADRITRDPDAVTCRPAAVAQPGKEN